MKKSLAALALLLALALPAGAAAAGPLAVTPEAVVVAKTTVGMDSQMVQVDLRNDDSEAAKIEGIEMTGADADQFGMQGSNCGTLWEGQSCQVWFRFSPTGVGAKQAQLRIDVHERGTQTTPVAAEAVPVQMSWSPASHDFGLEWVHRSVEGQLQLENSGEAPVYMGNLTIAGADTGNFWSGASNCWSLPGGLIEPGQSCTVSVNFQAHESRAYEAELVATILGAEFGAALRGEGGRAELVSAQNPFDFGSAGVGAAGEVRTIHLTNEGNLPGAFFIAVVAGGDSGSFELLDESCSGFEPVQPGESCAVQIRFRPLSAGAKRARLALFGDGDGGTMVMLQGEGLAARVGLSAAGLSFGFEEAGSRGPARTILVENDGAAAATVEWVALAGADPDQFALAGEECTEAVLGPGERCAVRVRFAPDSAGEKAARLRVGGGFGALSASLSGVGTGAGALSRGRPAGAGRQARPSRFAHNRTIRAPRSERRLALAKKKAKAKKAEARKKARASKARRGGRR